MREFVRGWKRKAGVATLVLTCVFTALWVRSQSVNDQIALTLSRRMLNYGSTAGGIYILIFDTEWPYDVKPDWSAVSRDDESIHVSYPLLFEFVQEDDERILTWRALIVSHLSITLPLALMSAYLLFSKPRQPKNHTDDTPRIEPR